MQCSRRKGRESYYITGEERGEAGEEEMTEIQVVSGETNTSYRDISVVVAENNSVCKAKMLTVYFAK